MSNVVTAVFVLHITYPLLIGFCFLQSNAVYHLFNDVLSFLETKFAIFVSKTVKCDVSWLITCLSSV